MAGDIDAASQNDDRLTGRILPLGGDWFDSLFSEQPAFGLTKVSLASELPDIQSDSKSYEKRDALLALLRALSNMAPESALSDEDLRASREMLTSIYGGNGFRHQYSDISTFMYEVLEDSERKSEDLLDALPLELTTLATNLSAIRIHMEETESHDHSHQRTSSQIITSVGKLDDHVELELQRMKYQVKQNSALHSNLETLTGTFRQQVNETQEQVTNKFKQKTGKAEARLTKGMKSLTKQFERGIQEAEAKSQRNYVSVLGIFISLVISFSAGIKLSTEVLNALADMSVYRLIGVLTVIVTCIFDMIILLLYFVLEVSEINSKASDFMRCALKVVNGAAIALLVALLFVWRHSWFG